MNPRIFFWTAALFCFPFSPTLQAQSAAMKGLHQRVVGWVQKGDLEKAALVVDSMESALLRDPGSVALVRYAQGLLSLKGGNPTQGIALFEKTIAEARAQNDRYAEGLALHKLGIQMRKMQGDSVAAAHFPEALKAFEEVGYARGICSVKYEQAGAAFRKGEEAEGDRLLYEAMGVALEIDEASLMAMVLHRKGVQLYRQSRFRACVPFFLAALAQFEREGLRVDQGRALQMLGSALYQTGELNEAEIYFRRAVQLADSIGHADLAAGCRVNLAVVFNDRQMPDSAMGRLVEAVEIYRRAALSAGEAVALGNLSELYGEKGNFELAILHQREALAIDRLRVDSVGIAYGCANLGEYHRQQAEWTAAMAYFNEYKAITTRRGGLEKDALVHEGMADCLEALGRYKEALEYAKMDGLPLSEGGERLKSVAEQVLAYENGALRQELAEQKGEREKNGFLLWGMGLLALGLALVVGWLGLSWGRSRKSLARMEGRVAELTAAAENSNRQIEVVQAALERKNKLLAKVQMGKSQQVDRGNGAAALVVRLKSDPDWAEAMVDFEILFPNFIGKLQAAHPGLSPTDLRILILLRLNLSSAEMAEVLHITLSGVNKGRQRVRKKMGLSSDQHFAQYLQQFQTTTS